MAECSQYHRKAQISAEFHSSAVHYNAPERCGITLTPAEMNRDCDCDYNGVRAGLISRSFQLICIKSTYGIKSKRLS